MSEHETFQERLQAYHDGELPPEEKGELEAHLSGCADCRRELDEIARFAGFVRRAVEVGRAGPGDRDAAVGRLARPSPARPRTRGKWIGAAASFGAAVACLAMTLAGGLRLPHSPHPATSIAGPAVQTAGEVARLSVLTQLWPSGSAREDVPVRVEVIRDPYPYPVATWEGKSDSRGLSEVELDLSAVEPGRYTLRVISGEGESRQEVVRELAIRSPVDLVLSSDKGIYRPGETIRLRTLARHGLTGVPVGGEEATFEVLDGKGNKVFKVAEKTSRFGIAAASLTLADEVVEGTYTLRVRVGEVEQTRTVPVERYQLPPFRIDVSWPGRARATATPRDRVRVGVLASYLFGEPVPGGRLRVTVEGRTSTGELDPSGRGEVEIEAHVTGFARPYESIPVPIEVSVEDPAGHVETVGRTLFVSRREILVQVLRAWREVGLFVVASYADRTPCEGRVLIDGGQGARIELRTNRYGVGFAGTEAYGIPWNALVEARDGKGALGGGTLQELQIYSYRSFHLAPERMEYGPGEPIRAHLAGFSGPTQVLLLRKGHVLAEEVVDARGQDTSVELPAPGKVGGLLELRAFPLGSFGQSARAWIKVRPAEPLAVSGEVAGEKRERFRPGEEVKLRWRLTDAEGRPVAGAIGARGLDERTHLAAAERGFAEARGERSAPAPTPGIVLPFEAWSVYEPSGAPDPDRELAARCLQEIQTDDAEGILWATAGWDWRPPVEPVPKQAWPVLFFVFLMASGGLAGWALSTGERTVAVRVLGMGVFAVLALLLAAALLITGLGREMSMTAMDEKAVAGAASAPLAPGGKESAANLSTVRVRRDFREVLLWEPELVSDDSGVVEYGVTLPDSITTWRVDASGITSDGRAGEHTFDLATFQPFFIRPDLPRTWREGDEVELPVAIHNYSPENLSVEVRLDPGTNFRLEGEATRTVEVARDGVGVARFRLVALAFGETTLTVHASGGDFADAVEERVTVLPDGEPFAANASGRLDSPAAVELDLPAGAISGASRLIARLYPGPSSELAEGVDGILSAPHG